jgi:S1-C subfamily serine protease
MATKFLQMNLALAALIVSMAAGNAVADDGLVNCLDRDRDLVTRSAPSTCRGEIVDQAAADRVRQRRIQRILGQINQDYKLYPNRRRSGSGSGFFVTTDGALLTNDHVIARCKALSVQPMTGNSVRAEIVQRDAATDLALLRVNLSLPATSVAVFQDSPGRIGGGDISVIWFPLHGRIAIRPILPGDAPSTPGPATTPPGPDGFASRPI